MKQAQYTIMKTSDGLFVEWKVSNDEQYTVLFDTQEEAEEMIESFPKFFKAGSYEIKRGIYFIDKSINYKELKERDDYKIDLKEEERKSQRTLQEVLNTDLSPDKMGDYTPNQLATFLVENEIVKSAADVNRIVIEGLQRALQEDDEFPIHYYTKYEEMSEKGKAVNIGPCLTDDYIENEMC